MEVWTVCSLVINFMITFISVDSKFERHGVYRITPETEEQLKHISEILEEHPEVDIWQEPRGISHPVEFRLSHEHVPNVLRNIRDSGVTPSIVIPDLQRKIEEVQILNDVARSKESHMFERYHEFDEIMSWLEDKVRGCQDMCEIINIGSSYENRPLNVLKIGVPGTNKMSIWIDAGIHAREWIAPATAMFFIERLLDDWSVDDVVWDLINEYDFYIQPVVNPDGYEYTWRTDRTWRKTRSRSSSSECVGVDPNRNYDFHWGSIGGKNTTASPCSNTFGGLEPFSEPETRAQAEFILQNGINWKAFLTLHSYGQLWMAPYGYTKTPPCNMNELMDAGTVAVEELKQYYGTQYTVGSASQILYSSSGTSRDWAAGSAGIEYVYTIELRDKGKHAFILPPNQILPTGIETWAAVRAMLEHIRQQPPTPCRQHS